MQIVKSFTQGVDFHGNININPVTDQINEYLEYHPNYIAKSISVVDHKPSIEAFVLFDIREEKKPQEHPETNINQNKKYKKDGQPNGK